MSANLIFHWMLDLLDDGNLIADETEHKLNGTPSGNLKVVADEKFGSCLCFDGNDAGITIPDNADLRLHTYTAEVWIKPEQTNDWQGILGKPGRNFNIWLGSGGFIHHRFHVEENCNAGAPNTNDGSIIWGNWYHVAITNDGQTARTYINGNLVAKGDVGGNLEVDNTPLIVARNLDGDASRFYKGYMAHIRLYDDALTVDEIRRDMMQDESAASAFVRSHPIGFELYNRDNHHVLYIDDDPAGQALLLDIVNTSNRNIEFNDLGQTATPQNHHFELRFRPETLASANSDQIKVVTDGWSLDRLHQQGQAGGDSLYLLYNGSKTLEVAEKTTLKLTGLNADGRGGTRGTRVELISKNIHFSGETALLEGTRLQFLDIVNHRGRRNIPLHVGFVGSDTVLSDGNTPNTLKLRIANVSRDVGLRLSKGDATTPTSRFRISFDVQQEDEPREWALTDYTKVNGASLPDSTKKIDGASLSLTPQTQGVNSNWAQPEYSNLGQTVEWTIVPNEDTTLEANGYIVLELVSLVALASIGQANIYINFENIPDYEDEQRIVVVQKSPLLFSNGNVGIGTLPGTEKLKLEGDVAIAGPLSITGKSTLNGDVAIAGTLNITSSDGGNFAVPNHYMATGSLTIGSTKKNYGGGQGWNKNIEGTAGLLLETLDNTEIAVHDAGRRVASFMYYEGVQNKFTIGRDMGEGWGANSQVAIAGSLTVNGLSTLNGETKIAGPLTVTGEKGSLMVEGSCTISGDTKMNGKLETNIIHLGPNLRVIWKSETLAPLVGPYWLQEQKAREQYGGQGGMPYYPTRNPGYFEVELDVYDPRPGPGYRTLTDRVEEEDLYSRLVGWWVDSRGRRLQKDSLEHTNTAWIGPNQAV
jgi:cytoskeletal protein CcmA (bactofilin family)